MKRVVVFVLSALFLTITVSTDPAAAQLPPVDQETPDLLYGGGRAEFLLAWTEDRGGGNRVYAKRIRANGLPIGGPAGGDWELTAVAGGTTKGDQRWPAIASGLVVWSERVPGGNDYDLYAQRLFSNGRGKGGARLIAGGPGDQRHPDIIQSSRGDWLVVWSEDTNDAGDIMGVRLTTALTPRSAPFPVAQGAGTAEDPVIARDPTDPRYFLVLWTDDRNGNKDVYGTRVTDAGLPRSGPRGGHFPVIDGPEDDYAAALLFGRVSGGRRGDAFSSLLLWTHDDVAEGPNVMAQRLRANGLPVGRPLKVATGPGVQAWPAAASGPSDWLAVWVDDGLGTLDILGVEIGSNGLIRRRVRPLATD